MHLDYKTLRLQDTAFLQGPTVQGLLTNKDTHRHLKFKARTLSRYSSLRLKHSQAYRGTSLTRKRTPLGPYRRPMPRVLGGS